MSPSQVCHATYEEVDQTQQLLKHVLVCALTDCRRVTQMIVMNSVSRSRRRRSRQSVNATRAICSDGALHWRFVSLPNFLSYYLFFFSKLNLVDSGRCCRVLATFLHCAVVSICSHVIFLVVRRMVAFAPLSVRREGNAQDYVVHLLSSSVSAMVARLNPD
jgi:hypothetical protein